MGAPLFGAEPVPVELKGIGIQEHLGDHISWEREFKDEFGHAKKLSSYFQNHRPVILLFVYYTCPNLCHYLLNGFVGSLKQLPWSVGDKFDVITISINPKERPSEAIGKKNELLKTYAREALLVSQHWHFLVGEEKNIQTLTHDLGFNYRYDPETKEYAHSAAIMILTPDGKISRYLYGIQFESRDLKLALLEASQGKIGNVVDKLLLFCYHYDPKGRKYGILAVNLMKIAGIVAVLLLGIMLLTLFIKKQKK